MTISRRHFLAASGATLLGGAIGTLGRAQSAPPAARRPRFLVQFLLSGGIDAIFTTDPKLRGQVDARVDLPYGANEIVDLTSHRIGPFFAALRAEVPAMAIINGVDHGTVAHEIGVNNIAHMKRSFPIQKGLGIGLAGRIGEQLSETPLNEAWFLGSGSGTPSFLPARKGFVMQDFSSPETLLAKLWKLSEDDRSYVSKALGQEIAACNPSSDCDSLKVVRDMIDRMHGTQLPPPPEVTISLDDATNARLAKAGGRAWSVISRDAAFLLKNDLTRTIFCAVPHGFFDSHQNNFLSQRRNCLVFAEGLKVFLKTMRETVTKDGTSLYDQTAFVISSELGRNPFLNGAAGKDHLPHHPVILMGPGIKPGQYGQTDPTMVGMPVSPTTGKATTSGVTMQPNLNDVGATIFRWFSMDNAASGYPGRPLEFVLT